MPLLYQFAGSPYCEKVRWALDYKGVKYQTVNLVPGRHAKVTQKIAKSTSVPILVDDDHVVQGSADIISYLEKSKRHPPLTPTNSQDASMAHEWERYLDRNLGVPLRVFFYHFALPDRAVITEFLLRGTQRQDRIGYFFTFPGWRRRMKKSMGINAEAAAAACEQLIVTFDRLEERLAEHKYLAGPQFSRADLTASALLFHRWSRDWPAPVAVDEFFNRIEKRPFYQWARTVHQDYRQRS